MRAGSVGGGKGGVGRGIPSPPTPNRTCKFPGIRLSNQFSTFHQGLDSQTIAHLVLDNIHQAYLRRKADQAAFCVVVAKVADSILLKSATIGYDGCLWQFVVGFAEMHGIPKKVLNSPVIIAYRQIVYMLKHRKV